MDKETFMTKYAAAVGLISLCMVVLPLSGCLESQTSSSNNVGDDFVFISLEETEKHLRDYRGKIVILDMWATWCAPCQYQMIELKKVYLQPLHFPQLINSKDYSYQH